MTKTATREPAVVDPLQSILRQLRAQVEGGERYWRVLPLIRSADAAMAAWPPRRDEAASLLAEIEAAIDRCDANPPPRAWNILRVAPHMERRVRDTLADAGVTTYVPIETRWPKGYDRMSKAEKIRARPITRPLIPSYIFGLLPNDDALDLARGNHAVREVMHFEGRLIRVPAREIGGMVLMEACHGFDETWVPPKNRKGGKKRGKGSNSRWKAGQRVKVSAGPFGGFMGEVISASREARVMVLVTIFGRATPVELGEEEVRSDAEIGKIDA